MEELQTNWREDVPVRRMSGTSQRCPVCGYGKRSREIS